MSMGGVCAQPGLDPLRSGGTKTDPQPTVDHHGSSRLGSREQTVKSIESHDERR